MGLRTLQFVVGVIGISALVNFISLGLPFHTVTFFGGYLVVVFRMKTYPLWITAHSGTTDDNEGLFCMAVRKAAGGRDLCEVLMGTTTVRDAADIWCSEGIRIIFPSLCEGLRQAYLVGMFVTLTGVTQLALQGTACWLLYEYSTKTPNKKYRETAHILMIIGLSAHMIALAIYGILVLINLDDMRPHLFVSPVLSPSRSTGVSIGYWLSLVSLILQGVTLVLHQFIRSKEEKMLETAKRQERFEAEMSMVGDGQPTFEGDWGGGQPHGDWQGYGAQGGMYNVAPVQGYNVNYNMQPAQPMQQGYNTYGGSPYSVTPVGGQSAW